MSFRPVEYMGRHFDSIAALSREIQIPQSTIRRRLDEGAALVHPRDDERRLKRQLGRPVGHAQVPHLL